MTVPGIRAVVPVALAIVIGACAAPVSDRVADVSHALIPHPDDAAKKVEVYWQKPDGDGPFPALLFIHGHQERDRVGGSIYARVGRFARMAGRGYVAAAVSQPGYGRSDGPPDFCGPFSQNAALAAIEFVRSQLFVDPDRVAVLGYSRGATVAGMVAARDERLAAAVLGAGIYDLHVAYPTGLAGMDANIRAEAGTSKAAFDARSPLVYADRIAAPTLLLHGAYDDRAPVKSAVALGEALQRNGVPVTVRIFEKTGHGIPIPDQYEAVYPFLDSYLSAGG